MVETVPMNFISYQKLVKMVKDVYYSMDLSYELALEMGFNWHCLCMIYFKVTKFSWHELCIKEGGSLSYRRMDDKLCNCNMYIYKNWWQT